MKNLLTVFFCIVSITVFSQSFNITYPNSGFGDQVELEETGYRVMGFGSDFSGNHLLVIHTNKFGDTIQTRKIYFGFDFFSSTFTLRSAIDSDGNHYLNMSSNSDSISLVKLSPVWQEVWRKNLTNKQGEVTALKVTADNHIIAAADQKLFKLDTDGNIIWQKFYGEYDVIDSRPYSIIETTNGDLFLYSIDYWMDTNNFYFETPTRSKLRIFNQFGQMRDSTLLPRLGNNCLQIDDQFICVATSLNYTIYPTNLLFRHDFNGFISDVMEMNNSNDVFFYRMVENQEGNLVFLGAGNNSLVLHCMSKEGDSLWTRFINNEAGAVPMDMKLAADGGYVVSTFKIGFDKIYPGLIKTDVLGNINALGFEESDAVQKVKVYPNPGAEYVVFELEKPLHTGKIIITDITGRLVVTLPVTGEKTILQTGGLKPGVYFYKIEDIGDTTTGKLIIGL